MLSKDLAEHFESLIKGKWRTDDPIKFWSSWISVTEAEAFDMLTLMFLIVDKAGAAPTATPEETALPIRNASCYQKVIKLTAISPWSDLLMLTDDGKAITLNRRLSTEDRDEVFRILYKDSRAVV